MAEIINQNQLYWPKINILDTLFFSFKLIKSPHYIYYADMDGWMDVRSSLNCWWRHCKVIRLVDPVSLQQKLQDCAVNSEKPWYVGLNLTVS